MPILFFMQVLLYLFHKITCVHQFKPILFGCYSKQQVIVKTLIINWGRETEFCLENRHFANNGSDQMCNEESGGAGPSPLLANLRFASSDSESEPNRKSIILKKQKKVVLTVVYVMKPFTNYATMPLYILEPLHTMKITLVDCYNTLSKNLVHKSYCYMP